MSQRGDERLNETGTGREVEQEPAGAGTDTVPDEAFPGGGALDSDREASDRESTGGESVDQLQDRLLRVAAEFENYKKRRQRETEDLLRYGYESLARDLLPVLDSFERAIESSEATREYGAFHDGIVMILDQLREVMRRHGIERLEPQGEVFDPHTHEAVGVINHDGFEPGHIAEVLEPGYRIHERVLRAPRVLVTGEKDGPDTADSAPDESAGPAAEDA